mgnify:CR=1 FL=1
MKQVFLVTLLAVSLLGSKTYAKDGDLEREIKKKVDYPDFGKSEKLHGLVMVKFNVDESGAIEVQEINASHDHLAEYVRTRLESIRVEERGSEGEHYVKFRFRFVEV